jgi:hypothetical protein
MRGPRPGIAEEREEEMGVRSKKLSMRVMRGTIVIYPPSLLHLVRLALR